MAEASQRHSLLVRVTHWLTTLAFLALLVSGLELVVSHPRFYWGEVGNVNTRPLFHIPIPASRNLVPTGYGYVLPDQNGWSRYLHFQSAWVLVLTGLVYVGIGLFRGHFRRALFPTRSDLSAQRLMASIREHLRFKRPGAEDAWSYNVLQRLAYLVIIFVGFPLIVWTGLAMSPSFVSAFPTSVNVLGGAAIGAYAALLADWGASSFSFGAHLDGDSCRILEPGAGDGYWTCRRAMSRRCRALRAAARTRLLGTQSGKAWRER